MKTLGLILFCCYAPQGAKASIASIAGIFTNELQ
jgi:hypothetical protein